MTNSSPLLFGEAHITIENIVAIAEGRQAVALSHDSAFRERIDKGVAFLETLLRDDGVIYGVTTGYGDSCTVQVPAQRVEELPLHLARFHGCGLGDVFSAEQGRAILAVRLASLTQGFSGVTPALLERLVLFINDNIVPVIPQEGSVGASGDLTPLSYIAATLMGERDVWYGGERRPALHVLNELALAPLTLRPKEGLALMNGTAVMTALACLAFVRADYLAQLAARITSMMSIALQGNANHFDEKLFSVKPHPGQNRVAAWIRSDLPQQ
jgi:histidine ammonia-lyase